MLSFFKKAPKPAGTALEQALRQHLRDVDENALHGVLAVAGLLVKVAMADAVMAPEEEALIRSKLGTVGSLGAAGIEAIAAAMRDHADTIAEVEAADYARWLGDKRDRAFCLAVLQLLVDVARADQKVSDEEAEGLRRIALDLKLTADDLNGILAG